MAMSPSITQLRTGERADEALAEFLRAAGASSIDSLRDAPLEAILHAQTASLSPGGAGLTNFSPSIDGDLFPGDIAVAAARSAVPLVIGTTRDEARLFNAFNPRLADPSDEQIDRLATDAFGDDRHDAIARYRRHLGDPTPFELYNAIHTDAVFRAPAWRLAAARHDADMPTWMYWFTWATPAFDGRLGSCHALDVPFAFHTLHRNGVEMMTGDDPRRFEVADTFSRVVIDLAHHGHVGWEPYSLPTRPTRRIDVHSDTLSAPDAALHQLWLSR
jgi:para-nitrobenzyl esterase